MTGDQIAIVLLSASTLALLAVVLWQWYGGRGGRSRQSVRELMRQMDRLATDIDRRMGGALADMQATIGVADEKIEKLADLLDRTDETATDDESPRPAEAEHSGHDDAEPSPDPPAATGRSMNEAHQEILHLSGEGLTPAQIAEQLGRPVGEVDLILRLHGGAATPHPKQQAG